MYFSLCKNLSKHGQMILILKKNFHYIIYIDKMLFHVKLKLVTESNLNL